MYFLALLAVQAFVLPHIRVGVNSWLVQLDRRARWLQDLLWWGTISSFIAGYLWLWWLCPYLEAGDPVLVRRVPLHKRLRVLRVELAAPALTFTLAGCLIGSRTFWADRTAWSGGLVLLISGAVSTVLGLILYWPVSARLKRTLAAGPCCPQCGYDLRGNPQAETCPECGQKVERPTWQVTSL